MTPQDLNIEIWRLGVVEKIPVSWGAGCVQCSVAAVTREAIGDEKRREPLEINSPVGKPFGSKIPLGGSVGGPCKTLVDNCRGGQEGVEGGLIR